MLVYKNCKSRSVFLENQMKTPRRGIPQGKFRVVGVDLFDHIDYPVGNFHTPKDAFAAADARNNKRKGDMDDVFYVYDDKGKCIRDESNVDGYGVSP